ncbi:MAG: universal stress protein [Acidobacteriaceae bacterium]|nr:universal stress protein [Acidobacteriaceae bacterium]
MKDAAFTSILFPVDFSPATTATVPHVRGLAQWTGAKVTLLHVVPWLSAWYGATELLPPIPGDEGLRALEQGMALTLKAFHKQDFSDVNCECRLDLGAVAETITETAGKIGADLIMMPTRGLGRSRPFLIGSTTAKVLHDAPCTVWTSPHLHALPPFRPYRHILCTVDRDHIPPGFLEEAVRLATCWGSELSFLTAVPSTTGGSGDERSVCDLNREFPQAHANTLAFPNNCRVLTRTGPVGDVVRQTAESEGADLIVAHRGHLPKRFGKFRTHTYEIVLESPCPVLSLCLPKPTPAANAALSCEPIAYAK